MTEHTTTEKEHESGKEVRRLHSLKDILLAPGQCPMETGAEIWRQTKSGVLPARDAFGANVFEDERNAMAAILLHRGDQQQNSITHDYQHQESSMTRTTLMQDDSSRTDNRVFATEANMPVFFTKTVIDMPYGSTMSGFWGMDEAVGMKKLDSSAMTTLDDPRGCRGFQASSDTLFPCHLVDMLNDAESGGFSDIVCWESNGTCFNVPKKSEFEEYVLPKYFRMRKYKSFTKQLHNYGFYWVRKGPSKGGYYHSEFTRKDADNARSLQRGVKSRHIEEFGVFVDRKTKRKAPPSPRRDPSCTSQSSSSKKRNRGKVVATEEGTDSECSAPSSKSPMPPGQASTDAGRQVTSQQAPSSLEDFDLEPRRIEEMIRMRSLQGHK